MLYTLPRAAKMIGRAVSTVYVQVAALGLGRTLQAVDGETVVLTDDDISRLREHRPARGRPKKMKGNTVASNS